MKLLNTTRLEKPVKPAFKPRFKVSLIAASSLLAMGMHGVVSAADVTVYGYAKADFVFSSDQNTGKTVGVGGLDTTPGLAGESSFQASAEESRLGVTVNNGQFSATVEGDYFGGKLRLRHAYGQYGNVTAGQTWTTFGERDWIAYPRTLDFDTPVGLVANRPTQLRITAGNFDFAIENPSATISAAAEGVSARSAVPDLVARYASKGDAFSWMLSGLLRNAEVDGGAADGESASVVGIMAAARLNLGSAGALSATLMQNGNNRGNNYGAGGDFVVVGNQLESVDSTAFSVAFQGNAGPNSSYNLVYSEFSFDDEYAGILGAGSPETLTTLHANYIYSPTAKMDYGIEVSRAEREDYSGNSADNTRLQMSVQYNF
ncbi:MAG: DcaP family trimeric outer membrane transporter [Arenicella sp.]